VADFLGVSGIVCAFCVGEIDAIPTEEGNIIRYTVFPFAAFPSIATRYEFSRTGLATSSCEPRIIMARSF
jgi:hypothetical protein